MPLAIGTSLCPYLILVSLDSGGMGEVYRARETRHRAPNYQNVRLMDELESAMFVYEHISIVDAPNDATDRSFWTHFSFLLSLRAVHAVWRSEPKKTPAENVARFPFASNESKWSTPWNDKVVGTAGLVLT